VPTHSAGSGPSSRYWDSVTAAPDRLPAAWRVHCRDRYLDLIVGWLGPLSGRWMKTDLWEETTPARSLIDRLAGPMWVGVDLSFEVASRAGAGCRVVADMRRLPFRSGAFDGILSTSTLDHFPSPSDLRRSLTELRRALAPGGRFLVTFDNPANPLIRLRNALPAALARATGLVPYVTGCTLSERTGRDELTRCGFEVTRTGFLLHVPLIVGTRLARFGWYAREVMPWLERLGSTPVRAWTGHYVAFLARAGGGPGERTEGG
jgi:SAM-dependent methyltransferase